MSLLEYAIILALVLVIAFVGLQAIIGPRLKTFYEELIAALDDPVAPTPTPEVATVPTATPDPVATPTSPVEPPKLLSNKAVALAAVFVLGGAILLVVLGIKMGTVSGPLTSQFSHWQSTLSAYEGDPLSQIEHEEALLRIHQVELHSLELKEATYRRTEVPLWLVNEIDWRKEKIARHKQNISELRRERKRPRKKS